MPFNVRLGKRHEMRVKLHPNNLRDVEGAYVARTSNEATLSREDILAAMRERGGFAGNIEDFLANLDRFMDEAEYQACDGFAVNLGPVTINAKVNGPFNDVHEPVTPETHPISFHARINDELNKLIPYIDGRVEGIADSGAYIQSFTDITTGKVNAVCTKDGAFTLSGAKLKIARPIPDPGPSVRTGVFFYTPGSPAISIGVTGNLIENTPTKISGIVPELLPDKDWFVEVRTYYSGSGRVLKELRTIRSAFTVRQA